MPIAASFPPELPLCPCTSPSYPLCCRFATPSNFMRFPLISPSFPPFSFHVPSFPLISMAPEFPFSLSFSPFGFTSYVPFMSSPFPTSPSIPSVHFPFTVFHSLCFPFIPPSFLVPFPFMSLSVPFRFLPFIFPSFPWHFHCISPAFPLHFHAFPPNFPVTLERFCQKDAKHQSVFQPGGGQVPLWRSPTIQTKRRKTVVFNVFAKRRSNKPRGSHCFRQKEAQDLSPQRAGGGFEPATPVFSHRLPQDYFIGERRHFPPPPPSKPFVSDVSPVVILYSLLGVQHAEQGWRSVFLGI